MRAVTLLKHLSELLDLVALALLLSEPAYNDLGKIALDCFA
jgi:hypothetical protein